MTAGDLLVFGRAALGRSARTWAANLCHAGLYNVAPTDPLAAKGKTIFEAQSCNACHGDGGWARRGFLLVGIAAKSPPAQLAEVLKASTAKGEWPAASPAVDLPPDDLKALIAYVESFK